MKGMLKENYMKVRDVGFDFFKDFVESEKSSGYLLVFITLISMIVANSQLGQDYLKVWHSHIDLSFSQIQLNFSIEHWINDGLMVIFFLLVGLEIEREIYEGELSTIKKASLPAIAALGGMLVPAAIHYYFNAGTASQRGFGIPMATDIAFTLGALSLLGKRVPISLKIFLTALAIIDDLGAIIVIALFYTSNISIVYLLGAFGIIMVLLLMNRLKVNKLSPYLILGVVMWYFMLKSGVHSTISGVILAFLIPFRRAGENNISHKLEKKLNKPVAFFILPIFALANTAILLPADIGRNITEPNSIGIIFGLVLGKPVGIFIFSYLAVKIGFGILPNNINWKLISGAACLAGIGFTMSIFITNLAFKENTLIVSSKLSVIVASTISTMVGLMILKLVSRKNIKITEVSNTELMG
jgi:Na+:H+ antiporter, NhaA family